MPETIAVIGKILATKIIAGITVAAVVKTAAVYAISQMLTKSARSKASGLGSGTDLTMTREPAPVRRIVYGETRVSGPMAFANISGEKNSTLCVAVLLAAHECEAVGAYLVDDEQVTPGTGGAVTTGTYANKLSMVSHLGDQTTADAMLVAKTAGVWTSSHILRGITYLAAKLTYDTDVYSGGLPNLSVILRGKKVYDPRSGLTVWAQNPALIVRDYLTNADYGLGCTADEIDDALIIAAANVCDESVALASGGTEARYRCNGTFTTDAEPATIIETILSTMAGSITYSGGKFRVYAGAYAAPTVTLDEDDMAGAIEFQPATGIREACNIVKGSFTSPADLYQPRDFPRFVDPAHITADGEEITTDLDLAFVSSPAQAQRLAKIHERKARLGGTVSLKCNLSAFRCQTGETIAVSNTRLGWSEKVFSVQEWRFAIGNDGALGIELTCRETDSSIYDWSASEEGILTTTSQFSNPPTTMQNVTGEAANATPGTLDDLNGGTGGGTPEGIIAVQSRGGAWKLCGHAEITRAGTYRVGSDGYVWHGAAIVASTPPRRYKRWAGIGSITATYYEPGCGALTGTPDVTTAAGAQVYTPGETCALTQNDAAGMYLGTDRREDYTNTSMAITPETGGCMAVNAGYHARITGSQLWQLTDEDTDESAWQRLLATAPAWTSSPNTAIRTVPATGITGVRRSIRYRTEHTAGEVTTATLTGLAAWARYRLAVHLSRRPVTETGAADGDWADAGTVYSPGWIANLEGEGGIDWQEVEPDSGYETKVASTDVEQY